MTDQQDKDLLTLYRRSRQEEPSQLTDTRIRQAARKAVSIKSVETRPIKNRSWLLGLSTAAVMVLSFSVVLQVWMDQDEPVVIQQESSSAPVSRPKLKPKPSFDVSEPGTDDRYESSLDRASGMPAPAAPVSTQAIGMQEPMSEKELSEMAADREVVRKKAQAPAPTPARMLEQSKAESHRSDGLAIPQLPDSVKGLQAMATGLVVERSESGLIAVYSANKLILTVQQQPQGSIFKAWPGSEVLGVEVNWQLSPQQLQRCEDGPVYLKCPVQRNVDAYFEGNRLDFVQWVRD